MFKRAAGSESPEVLGKRRCLPREGAGWSFGTPAVGLFDPPQCGLQAQDVGSLLQSSAGSLKRRRGEDTPGENAAVELVNRLRSELERVASEANARVAQADLINKNLQRACEEQQKELVRVNQENKLLKRSVLSLNNKRELAERDALESKQAVDLVLRRCRELESANITLCMQKGQSGMPLCGPNRWDSGNGGSGPVC